MYLLRCERMYAITNSLLPEYPSKLVIENCMFKMPTTYKPSYYYPKYGATRATRAEDAPACKAFSDRVSDNIVAYLMIWLLPALLYILAEALPRRDRNSAVDSA